MRKNIILLFLSILNLNCLNMNPSINFEDLFLSLLNLSPAPVINNSKNWKKKIRIRIDNSSQSTNLLDFPVLIRLNSQNFNYFNAAIDGRDIRFFDATESKILNFEIDIWNTNGDSIIWVNVPLITANSSAEYIWLYYSNPNAQSFINESDVWDSNYRSVLHFTNLNDSTKNQIHATSCNGLDDGSQPEGGSTQSIGFISGSQEFNGNNQCLRISSAAIPTAATLGTIEVWVNAFSSSIPQNLSRYIFTQTNANWSSTNNRIYLSQYNCTTSCGTGASNFYFGLGNRFAQLPPNGGDTGFDFTLNQWAHIALTWNAGTVSAYFNGNQFNSTYDTNGFITNGIEPIFNIGSFIDNPDPNQYWHGKIDEMRFSNVSRSSDWIRAQYLSTSNSFLIYGKEEENL